jgi:hypothetical protein
MEQTNIERFDLVTAKILASLYAVFPEPSGLSPEFLGMIANTFTQNDLGEIMYSDEWRDLDRFIHYTARWLAEEGYLSNRTSPQGSLYTLSAVGLKSMKQVAQPEIGSETIGEKIKKASADGATAATSKLVDQFLAIGASVITTSIGLG